MRIRAATIATAFVLAALLINHWWVGVEIARIQAAAGGPPGPPANFGVNLPGHLKFLVKLDHFAVDFGYVLIPFLWVVVFLIASIWLSLRGFFGRSKTARSPEDWPVEG
jgi:hypothetical protein